MQTSQSPARVRAFSIVNRSFDVALIALMFLSVAQLVAFAAVGYTAYAYTNGWGIPLVALTFVLSCAREMLDTRGPDSGPRWTRWVFPVLWLGVLLLNIGTYLHPSADVQAAIDARAAQPAAFAATAAAAAPNSVE